MSNYCALCAIDIDLVCPKCGANAFSKYRSQQPIVCLPLMRIPAREVEKSTKYLPDVWTCAELRLKNDG